MAKKIEKLSDKDLALIPSVASQWIEVGRRTGTSNRPLSEKTISEIYVERGLTAPGKFEWYSSPYAAIDRLKELGVDKNNQLSCGFGSHDVFWIAFYDYFQKCESVKVDAIPIVDKFVTLANEIGWWWPFDEMCIITERPSEIHVDQAGRLHNDNGMALKYADDRGLYSWHGFTIPRTHEWMITDKTRITPAKIEKEANAELRRIMLEIYGFSTYISKRKAKLISEDVDGAGHARKLYEIVVGEETVRFLELINSSVEPDGTYRKFHIGAMRGDNPHDCVAASFGFNPDKFKEAVCS